MKKISKEIFAPYLYEANSIRPLLENPFLCNGSVCATDNKVLLMIKEDLLEDKFEVVKNTPDVSKVIPVCNCELVLNRNVLSETINNLPKKDIMKEISPEISCMECEGDGEVEWKYEDRNYHNHSKWFECPCCGGTGVYKKAVLEPTGRKEPDFYALVILNGVGIWGTNLQILLDTMDFLGIAEVTIQSLHNKDSCLIRIAEGVDFVFMPVYDHSVATAIHHLNISPKHDKPTDI